MEQKRENRRRVSRGCRMNRKWRRNSSKERRRQKKKEERRQDWRNWTKRRERMFYHAVFPFLSAFLFEN